MPEGADVDETVLGTAFLVSPYASFILDWQGTILVCNRRAERSFCPPNIQDSENLRGASFCELTTLENAEVLLLLRKGAAAGHASLPMLPRAPGKPSEKAPFRVSLLRSATRGERLILLTQDQLKPTAEALTKMNLRRGELLKEVHNLKDDNHRLHEILLSMEAFAHAASHDLRTPINTLLGSLQFFGERYNENLPETAQEFLKVMMRAAHQMESLTAELLDHSVSTSAQIQFQEVEVSTALDEACADIRSELDACDGTIRITGDPKFQIHADPALLRLVLTNILSNAIKFRAPTRALEVDIEIQGSGKQYWSLSIKDNGVGFDPAESTRIFLPFHRANHDVEGTGIGLSTCAEICRRHNWIFTADSKPGNGAVFTVTFGVK
ncbi:HAMP domain-containing histidine kinase [Epibacterium ulvae]|nr:HAMP domain-containing histidine kinase [Epibacterium ulvae]